MRRPSEKAPHLHQRIDAILKEQHLNLVLTG